MAVFLTEGFFTGVDEGFFALVVVFALGLPGAVFFWRVEVVFELFAFAFGVVVFVPDAFVEVFLSVLLSNVMNYRLFVNKNPIKFGIVSSTHRDKLCVWIKFIISNCLVDYNRTILT